jgi:uncharacterized protein (TIGR03083 family)
MTRGDDIDTEFVAMAVTAERLALTDLLDRLEPDEWQTPSLCVGWTVHQVVAHLSQATLDTIRSLVIGAIKARGSFDRMVRDTAIGRADQVPGELLDELKEAAAIAARLDQRMERLHQEVRALDDYR